MVHASIARFDLAVANPIGAARRIPARLLLDRLDASAPRAAIPVGLRCLETGEVARVFAKRRVAADAELTGIVREALDDYSRINLQVVPGVIQADPGVLWQAVVDVVSLFRTAGVQDIEFVRPRPRK